MFASHARKSFWDCYYPLPIDVRQQADKQFALFETDPWHPSLHLKQIRGLWSARITIGYRALARRRGNTFYWFWIGDYITYIRLLQR